MSKTPIIQPWKKICILRQEIRDRKVTASDFAVDLQKVISGGGEVNPVRNSSGALNPAAKQ